MLACGYIGRTGTVENGKLNSRSLQQHTCRTPKSISTRKSPPAFCRRLSCFSFIVIHRLLLRPTLIFFFWLLSLVFPILKLSLIFCGRTSFGFLFLLLAFLLRLALLCCDTWVKITWGMKLQYSCCELVKLHGLSIASGVSHDLAKHHQHQTRFLRQPSKQWGSARIG